MKYGILGDIHSNLEALDAVLEQMESQGVEKYVSVGDLKKLIGDKDLKILQMAEPVEEKTLKRLNETFFTQRPDVKFRVYGFYSTPCDLKFLSLMTNVQNLSADCLDKASGIESIAALPNLKGLGIGIWSLEDLGFLSDVSNKIESLFIGATKSIKPNLEPLSRFKNLKSIYLEGQRKSIDVLSALGSLEKVTLRSITVPDIDFLLPLENMWSLDIKLGGTKNLAAIEGMTQLKYLELWQIMGFSDISLVSTLTGLQYLFLQSLSKVTSLPEFRNLAKLRRISLETMKGLKDVSTLRDAPVLTDYLHVAANNLQPDDYKPLLENKSVKNVLIGFGSDKKNNAFRAMMAEYGKARYEFRNFEFID